MSHFLSCKIADFFIPPKYNKALEEKIMKKKLVICIFIILLLIASIPLILTLTKQYPSEITYNSSNYWGTSNGMYYITGNFLKYYDYNTHKAVPLCSKPDCSHNSADCNAYYNCQGSAELLLYNDTLFISYANIEILGLDTDTDTAIRDCAIYLEQCQLDGANRKIIYKADNGSVLSMMAKNGFLYYTAYTTETSNTDRELVDNHLFEYNLRFQHTKELATLHSNKDQFSASLEWITGTELSSNPYLVYVYKNKDNQSFTQFFYLTENKHMEKYMEPLPIEEIWSSRNVFQYKNTFYVFGSSLTDTDSDKFTLGILQKDGTIKEILSTTNASGTTYGNYLQVSIDDTSRLMYDFRNGNYYLSKYIVTNEEVNIPDILNLIENDDICYIDSADYTGIEAGHVFTSDPRIPSSMSFKDYLEQYFVKLESGMSTGAFELAK